MRLNRVFDGIFQRSFALAVLFLGVVLLHFVIPSDFIGAADAAPMPQRYYSSAGYSPYQRRGGGASGFNPRGGGSGGGGGGSGGGSGDGGGVGSYGGSRRRYGYNANGRGRGGGGGGGGGGGRYSPGGRASANSYDDEEFAQNFLLQFGYIPKESNNSARANSVSLEGSIANFQRVAGIPQTGYLDKTTKAWMKRTRSGMSGDKWRGRGGIKKSVSVLSF